MGCELQIKYLFLLANTCITGKGVISLFLLLLDFKVKRVVLKQSVFSSYLSSFIVDTVEEVILSSTNLLVGIRSYLICSVTGGNPEPVAKWESDGVLQNTYSIRSSDAIVAMLPIIPTRDHNGRRYTCVVNQPDTSFKIISKSLVLRVTGK